MNAEWRPFKTAPTDGTEFIARQGRKMRIVNQPPGCALGNWEKHRGEWYGAAVSIKPSHWHPLPKFSR